MLDNLASGIAEGVLSPHSEEFALVCSLIKKVMVLSGKPVDKRVSIRLLAQLKQASKEELVSFVTKGASQLESKETKNRDSLLQ